MLSSKEESFSLVAFSGQQGFSGFRLKALLEEINADFPSITAVECKEIYLCALSEDSDFFNLLVFFLLIFLFFLLNFFLLFRLFCFFDFFLLLLTIKLSLIIKLYPS